MVAPARKTSLVSAFQQVAFWLALILGFGAMAAHAQQLPVVNHNGTPMYSPDKPFEHITIENCDGPGCGGGGGTPSSISLSPSPSVCPTGSFATGIDPTGNATGCALPGGISVKIKYVSVEGCPQDTDLTAGGGTDAAACINALWTGASPTNPILVYQDGKSLISGLEMPVNGGAFLKGSGGGISKVSITNCSLTSNVATFTTAANTLIVGQKIQLTGMSHCPDLDQAVVTVLSTGLSSAQFEANFPHADIPSGAETAKGITVYGTGFYLASSSGDMISNGRTPSGGSCELPGGAVPSQSGAGFGVSDLVLNGNASGQTDACFGIDIDNANNIQIGNVVEYNMRTYGVHLGNTSQVGIDHLYVYASDVGPSAPINTDGVHLVGPDSDITIANSYFHTADDAIAANAVEGYCGPITRLTITNSTVDNALRALRLYNQGAVCGNGLTPLVDMVTVSNYSGTTYGGIAWLGFNTVGTLNPAVTDFKWANSIIDAQGSSGIEVVTNSGRIDLDNVTFKNVSCILCSAVGAQDIATLKLHNVSAVDSSGSTFPPVLGTLAGGGGLTVTDLIVDGLGYYNDAGGTMSAGCPFCSGDVTNLYASNIDMGLINNFSSTNVTNLTGQAGPNSWALNAGGGPWVHNAYGGGAGFSWKPHSTGGGAFDRWYNFDSTAVFMCRDNNNGWVQIGGANTSDGCDSNYAAEPMFFYGGGFSFNRKPGVNGAAFGSVANWPIIHEASGTAANDCIDWQAQAFGAGGPSTVLKYCADGTVQIPNAQTGPATAPSGACAPNGAWVFSQDGHATFCSSGTWSTKI